MCRNDGAAASYFSDVLIGLNGFRVRSVAKHGRHDVSLSGVTLPRPVISNADACVTPPSAFRLPPSAFRSRLSLRCRRICGLHMSEGPR
jgi:hypothetical protein